MGLIYEKKQRVNGYECTYDYQLSPVAAMNYFQQSSQEQSEALGVGLEVMEAAGLAWFLVKYDVRFMEYPVFNQEITVETEAIAFHGFAAHRRFAIRDQGGRVMIEADTEWMLIDTESGRLRRMESVPQNVVYQAGDQTDFNLRRLTKISDWTEEKQFQVRYLDIDFNTHVNHVKYLAWALEILPLEEVKSMALSQVKIIYKNQGFYGDIVTVRSAQVANHHYRVDVINQRDELLCQLELILS
ncbi:acyl-[acyl-carrier-protein] thioesterase [Eubacterium sp.]|uniref:acyl-[acyl-carrier-protein] thioesterase n=1 Tax=Eubacterium sp. TaxID=142586 RepID=UPI002FC789B8